MQEPLQRQIEQLKTEFAQGQAELAALEQQRTARHQTLAQLSAQIQGLEQELLRTQEEQALPESPATSEP